MFLIQTVIFKEREQPIYCITKLEEEKKKTKKKNS